MRQKTLAMTAALLIVAACGGGESGTSESSQPKTAVTKTSVTPTTSAATVAAESTTTTGAQASTEPSSSAADPLDFMPKECLDLFVEFVQEIEPIVDGRHPTLLTDPEMTAMSEAIEPIQVRYDEAVAAAQCPDTDLRDDFELLAVMIEVTRDVAPGSSPMIEWVADLAGFYDGIADVATGDCDTDAGLLLELVAEAGGLSQVNGEQLAMLQNLSLTLFQTCPDLHAEIQASEEFQAFVND